MKRRKKKLDMQSDGFGAECAYCKRICNRTTSLSLLRATRDHVVPRCQGGSYQVWCCYQCNQIKGGMSIDDWEFFMKSNPKWWLNPEFARKIQGISAKLTSSQEFYAEFMEEAHNPHPAARLRSERDE